MVMYMGLIHRQVLLKAHLDFLVKCTRVPKNVQVLRKMFNDCKSLGRVGKSWEVLTTSFKITE